MSPDNGFTKSVPDEGSYEGNDAPWPEELRVFKGEGRIEIDFTDGKSCSLPAEYLRVESPSAEVQGHGGPATRKITSRSISPSPTVIRQVATRPRLRSGLRTMKWSSRASAPGRRRGVANASRWRCSRSVSSAAPSPRTRWPLSTFDPPDSFL